MAEKMNIYETISAVMAEVGAIGKDSKNQAQGFMFRGIDAVMNALNPAFEKYHLFVVPEVLEQHREERQSIKPEYDYKTKEKIGEKVTNLIYSIIKVKYTFYAEDGSSISAVVIGEGMDSGDKATNKAMSIAFKYACFQVFCIPTEEMKDPDAESHEVAPKRAVTQQRKDEKKSLLLSPGQMQMIEAEMKRTGVSVQQILKRTGANELKWLTPEEADNVIKDLRATPSQA